MKLFDLFYGKSKKRMKAIMTDELSKCQNYRNAREKSGVAGWHKIEPAPEGATIWRQKSATIGGPSKNNCGPIRVNRKGVAQISGYIGKNGFNSHT